MRKYWIPEQQEHQTPRTCLWTHTSWLWYNDLDGPQHLTREALPWCWKLQMLIHPQWPQTHCLPVKCVTKLMVILRTLVWNFNAVFRFFKLNLCLLTEFELRGMLVIETVTKDLFLDLFLTALMNFTRYSVTHSLQILTSHLTEEKKYYRNLSYYKLLGDIFYSTLLQRVCFSYKMS